MNPILILFLVVFLLNDIPVFASPTWMVFSFRRFRLASHMGRSFALLGRRCSDWKTAAGKTIPRDCSQSFAFDSENEVTPSLSNRPCNQIRGACGERSNNERLDGATHGRSTGEASFDVAEDE